ncbi:MAG: hypothetical protein A2133_12460 [Actinobacteria bacterium RBG_16_64_13]|nr:MAG: hypothetical protein A2133_12460 [Actinobacteria bacterium RBG_16_64_13]
MLRATKARIIGLALVGVVALSGAIYATAALAGGGATASPVTAPVAQTATDPQLRANILDMLRDRMGLTGPDAEQFADQMITRMQNIDPDFDLQEMVEWCSGYAGSGTQAYGGYGMMGGYGGTNGYGMMNGYGTPGGYGMMNGSDGGYDGWGMMGVAPAPNAGPSGENAPTPNRPGPQGSNSGTYPGGMMGAAPAPNAVPSGQGSDTPSTTPNTPGPQGGDFGSSPGGMMGGGMMGGPGRR